MAVAHRILTAAYHILLKQQPYRDLGANYLNQRRTPQLLNPTAQVVEQLGYQVSLAPVALPAG